MANKSLVSEAKEIGLAIELIRLGARLQLLELETSLSRERLLKLYKELKGVSPPKGMLPFSTDWFITWQPNIHSSLFINIHRYMTQHAGLSGIEAVMKAKPAAAKGKYVKKITMTSTMGPGIPIDLTEVEAMAAAA